MLIRSVPPRINFDTKINKLEYQTLVLNNNIPFYYIQDNHQSVCGVEIIFSGGKISEKKNGASFFSTNLLKSGIEGFNSNEINEFFELRGAFVQVQSGLDFNSLSLYCLSDKLEDTLPFFLKLFTHPIFPQKQLDKLVIKKEQELNINEQKSNYWATKLLRKALFNNHPYGQVLDKKDLKSITQDNLAQHWKEFSLNGIQFITMAGSGNLDQIIADLESHFDKSTRVPKINHPKINLSTPSSNTSKKLDKNEQTSLKIGLHTIDLNNRDYSKLSLANTILGGYFGSRLMQSIREEKGLTYGINSSVIHLVDSSYIQISADLKIGVGNEVIKLIKQELFRLTNNPIPDNELSKVKTYLIGEYKSNSETIFDKISKVKYLKINNLPNSYYIDHFNSILELNYEQVQQVLKKIFVPESFHTVLVE